METGYVFLYSKNSVAFAEVKAKMSTKKTVSVFLLVTSRVGEKMRQKVVLLIKYLGAVNFF